MIRMYTYPFICKMLSFVLCLSLPFLVFSQTTIVKAAPVVKGTTVVVAGKEYKRSGYHNFFWGKHYRKEWVTPVRVNNFYLDTAVGGLVPYEAGGGRQSTSLRMRDKKGREYVLRSVNKDFGKALPEEFRGTFMSNIAKDQVSISHPYGAVTIAPMAEAAGIYHTIPVFAFVPHQPALDSFNNEFGDQLYVFEQRPDGNEEDAPNFGYSKKVISTDKMLEHRYDDNDNRVDQLSFLRVRLFDMFIGDWGRHPDNWRWAEFEDGGQTTYKAIPRDRDQAYSLMDGFYPSLAAKAYKPFQGFHTDIKKVSDWNVTARSLDRLLLSELEKDEWIKEATSLQGVLTDSLISYSIHLLPPEVFAISGYQMIDKLRSRRDKLVDYAKTYYSYLSSYVDLAGTDAKELFSVNRLDNNETEVSIYKITKEGEVKNKPFYSRRFKMSETKEIRIYSLDKKDVITVKGETGNAIKVRVIDPQDKDSIVFDKDDLEHKVSISSGKKYEYDTMHQKKFSFILRPVLSSTRYKIFDDDPLKIFSRTGIKLVAAITYNSQPWRKTAYENVQQICADYGIFRGAFNVGYVGSFGRMIGKWDLILKARLDAPAVENYFGTGNDTKIINKTLNYYRTFSQRLYGSVGIQRDFAKYQHAELSVFYQSVKVEHTSDHFTSETPSVIDPAVFNPNYYGGVESGYSFIKTNDPLVPTRGFGVLLGAGYFRNINEGSKDFAKALLSTMAYVPLSKQFSWAVRAAGGMIAGDAPYYYLNTLGSDGDGEIRGYDRERFHGKHSFHLNNDLRWIVDTHNFLFNGRAGLLGFYDIGRVWQPGEVSNTWHDGYGFGVILVPYNKFIVTASYGISKEGGYTHFKAGFFF